jgi:hypothetical protein
VAPEEVFAAVTEEVIRLLPVDFAFMGRCESDGALTTVAVSGSAAARFPVGRRWVPVELDLHAERRLPEPLEVTSPAGKGTTLLIEIRLEDQSCAVSPKP